MPLRLSKPFQRNDIVNQQNLAEEEAVMGLLSKLKQYCLRVALMMVSIKSFISQ